jgi:hypothetical protein
MDKRTLLALFAAAPLAAPAVALAQMGGRRGGKGGDKDGGKGAGQPQINALETTLHEFEEDLKLAPAQQAAWNSYADAIRAYQKDLARERAPRAAGAGLALSQRLDRAADPARNRLTAIEDTIDLAKALLKSLTPEQQQAADPRLASLIGMSFASAQPCAPDTRPKA